METPPKTYAQRIKEARLKLGLSQREAALKWGFRQQTFNIWENGGMVQRGLYRERLERILRRIESQ